MTGQSDSRVVLDHVSSGRVEGRACEATGERRGKEGSAERCRAPPLTIDHNLEPGDLVNEFSARLHCRLLKIRWRNADHQSREASATKVVDSNATRFGHESPGTC